MKNIQELEEIATQVRRDIIRMVADVASGHPGGSLGCADLLTALYFKALRYDPAQFTYDGKNEDVFLLSNGHISPVWYSVLAHSGFFPVSEMASFRKLGTRLQGHPTPEKGLPGIRMASGSLGQGLSNGIGIAMAKKLNKEDKLVYVLMGDGETNEGQVWEAAQYASANKIDNLIAIIDWNRQQIDGTCEAVLSLCNFPLRWEALGWDVIIMEGNVMNDVVEKLEIARARTNNGRPVMILMETEMGYGVDFMQGTNAWHGKAPSQDQKNNALGQLAETLGDY